MPCITLAKAKDFSGTVFVIVATKFKYRERSYEVANLVQRKITVQIAVIKDLGTAVLRSGPTVQLSTCINDTEHLLKFAR